MLILMLKLIIIKNDKIFHTLIGRGVLILIDYIATMCKHADQYI